MGTTFTVHFPGLGIHNLLIHRVAFKVFGLPVYWYGLLIAAAVLLIVLLAYRESDRFKIKREHIMDVLLLMVPLMIIFARLYYVVFEWQRYQGDVFRMFDTRDGGLAFYGGVIGGCLALLILAKWRRYRLHHLLDFCVVYLPLGQAIGRWGNFFNQEAFGTNTSLPWGMVSEGTTAYLQQKNLPGIDPYSPVHPTFLYEFIANLLIFFLLHHIRRKAVLKLETVSWYLVLYGAVRFFVESIRTDALFIGNTPLRVSMLLSAIMVIAGLIYIGVAHRQLKKNTALSASWQTGWLLEHLSHAQAAPANGDEVVEAAAVSHLLDSDTTVPTDAELGTSPDRSNGHENE